MKGSIQRVLFNDTIFVFDKMNAELMVLLENELICDHVDIKANDEFNINDYLRHFYGTLSNENQLHFDTSKAGRQLYNLEFVDNFGHKLNKTFCLNVSYRT